MLRISKLMDLVVLWTALLRQKIVTDYRVKKKIY